MFFRRKYKHFLSIVCIFKNESAGIVEWIEHYLSEGVDHFYMIDNGSTDDSVEKIQPYIKTGYITLISDSTKWAQVELYNKHFLRKSKESEWLIVCDLDEFIYARNGYATIKDYLQTRSPKTGMIRIPWKMYGSSGLTEQPKSVVKSFIMRSLYGGKQNPGMNGTEKGTSKVIVNTRFLQKIDIHHCILKSKCSIEDPASDPIDLEDKYLQPINEELLSRSYLHLNHYAIQSRSWFLQVKCTRGAADGEAHEHVRNIEYFETYDRGSNDLLDDELSRKHDQTLPSTAFM